MSLPPVEITDLLWSFDASGRRLAIGRAEVVERLRASGQERAARLVSRMPVTDGDLLDTRHVDALGIRVHAELQRLAEELLLWRRVRATLAPLLAELRDRASVASASGEAVVPRPLRVVDVGCGLGYVVRALAARGDLGPDVELVGVDLNPVLVGEARRLAEVEGLAARFVIGDALDPGVAVEDGATTLVISTGLLHHLPPDALPGFFAAHARLGVAAFAHWDLVPGRIARVGAWVFHRARMREPLSRHDGNLSVRRAHDPALLRAAAATGAPGYRLPDASGGPLQVPAVEVLRPTVGVRG
ncbi:methyltransferase domain-containing protein [Intrasporangium sp. YIM S08009]|uniref:methyltransferase domain-containing protein n=1 Tax=Intrasporangium zincisolvens TaxID=3080018 RepID=UPI002B06221C|nr:methyltransferase domain-containing protein [Intrasporangium sp. YIM S08009]